MKRAALILLGLLLPAQAMAQARECRVPQSLPVPKRPQPEPRRVVPIGGYTLALSWSPEYCRKRGDEPGNSQCNGRVGDFGFVLHGLWPDGIGKLWPQYCRSVGLVPQNVARAALCVTPSVDLQQHEWEKHGSCAFVDADHYFRAGRILFSAVDYPDMDALSRDEGLTEADFAARFAAANSGLKPEMLRLQINARGWLEEVWLCLDRRMRPRSCRAQDQAARSNAPLRIWRGRR